MLSSGTTPSVDICEEVTERSRIRHQRLVHGILLAGQHGLHGEGIECLSHGESAQGGGASAGEGKDIGRSTTLRVDVDATHCGGEQVDQRGSRGGAAAEYRRLLPVRHLHNVCFHLGDVVEYRDGHHGPELLLHNRSKNSARIAG